MTDPVYVDPFGMKPKYISTMLEVKVYHPDTNKHFWIPRRKMQVEKHGVGAYQMLYLRGMGGGFTCKVTHQNNEWTFFEKINAVDRDFKEYRMKTTEYKRLMEK